MMLCVLGLRLKITSIFFQIIKLSEDNEKCFSVFFRQCKTPNKTQINPRKTSLTKMTLQLMNV